MKVLCVFHVDVATETALCIGLQQKGITVHVISGRAVEPYSSQLKNAGIPVDYLPMNKRIDRGLIRHIRHIAQRGKFDIVHAFNNKTVCNALFAIRGLPIKFIAYRGIVGNVSFLNPYSWLTYLHPRVDRIICVAEAVRRYLLEMRFLGLRISPQKLRTIHKGHDFAWYAAQPQSLSSFGIQPGEFVVGCIANYRPRKGIDYLLEAWKHLPPQHNIHLLLIGNMRSRKLEKLIARHPQRQCIHLAGFRSDAPQVLGACDVCILPAVKREGLPKAIIEGMVYGVPPIVTDSGGSPELIEAGISGLVIPPRSSCAIAMAILELYQRPDYRQQMGNAARERIRQQFNMQNTIEQTYHLYKELVPNDISIDSFDNNGEDTLRPLKNGEYYPPLTKGLASSDQQRTNL